MEIRADDCIETASERTPRPFVATTSVPTEEEVNPFDGFV